jgi:hypothetical protein
MAKAETTAAKSPQEEMNRLGKLLFAKKAKKAATEEALKEINKEITEIETVSLAKIMVDGEIEKFTIKGKGTIYMADELYTSVLKDDRPKLYAALRETGDAALIQDWVFPQTLTAYIKDRLKNGKSVPEVVKVTHIPTAKTRASGKAKPGTGE